MPFPETGRELRWPLLHVAAGSIVLLMSVLGKAGDALAAPAEPRLLTPPPRHLTWTGDGLRLADGLVLVADEPDAAQPARLLAEELKRLHGIAATVSAKAPVLSEAPIGPSVLRLVLSESEAGRSLLPKLNGRGHWPPPRNVDDAYLVEVGPREAVIFARSRRGLIYGCQTLLQLVETKADQRKQFMGVQIADYPQLEFRGLHLCIFPMTELAEVRKAILWAGRFKYNAVVLELWASLKSKKYPETAYENTYTPEQIRPLVELGKALGMEMIPMVNSWGHAAGMSRISGEHVVLDRHPEMKDLFEADGWTYRLSNPAVYDHLFGRYDELLELFGPTKYFHVGMDEAWGHLGKAESEKIAGGDPVQLTIEHHRKIHDYFAKRNITVIMWHDMLVDPKNPEFAEFAKKGGEMVAFGGEPFNTYKALPHLPKDVVIGAWNYYTTNEWPVPKHFHDKGYRTLVCPWNHVKNTLKLFDIAKKHDLFGVLETTWNSLSFSMPSVGQCGVLGWVEGDYDLKQIPFDHWLVAQRALPICDLPHLETTLDRPRREP